MEEEPWAKWQDIEYIGPSGNQDFCGNDDKCLDAVDVTEIYSPERVTTAAVEAGLSAGSAIDLAGVDSKGRSWDLSKPAMQQEARRAIREGQPKVLIGSLMCRDFSQMMRIN